MPELTIAQLDALNAAAAHEASIASGSSIDAVVQEVISRLPSSQSELEAWADHAERVLEEERGGDA